MNKFPYPELVTEPYNNMRWYHTPSGKFYPSITTILGVSAPEESKKALENWRNSLGHAKADAYSKERADHGTNVHLLAERYLKKEEVNVPIGGKPVPHNDLIAFNALKLKLDKIQEVWGQEVSLYSDRHEVGGRCDLIGVFKDKPVIIDFKTAGRIKSRADIGDYELQLLFYADAHNELFGTNIEEGVVLMVAQNGFPLEFIIKFTDELRAKLSERIAKFWETTLAKV